MSEKVIKLKNDDLMGLCKDAIIAKVKEDYNITLERKEVLFTNGGKVAENYKGWFFVPSIKRVFEATYRGEHNVVHLSRYAKENQENYTVEK